MDILEIHHIVLIIRASLSAPTTLLKSTEPKASLAKVLRKLHLPVGRFNIYKIVITTGSRDM